MSFYTTDVSVSQAVFKDKLPPISSNGLLPLRIDDRLGLCVDLTYMHATQDLQWVAIKFRC